MAPPHWDLMRKKYRCRRRHRCSLNLNLKRKFDGFSRLAAKFTLPFRGMGTLPLSFFLIVAWLTFTVPVGEAAPIYRGINIDHETVTSALDSRTALPQMGVLDLIDFSVGEFFSSVENLVVVPTTAAVMAVYLIAALCLCVRARSLKRDIMHVFGVRDAKTGRRPYMVTMTTGLIPGAGTRADVLLRMTSTSACSPVVNISQVARSMKLANPVRRAAQSSLVIWLAGDFGTPRTIQVKFHKSRKNSKWLLKSVTVTDILAKVQRVACVNSWIKGKEPHEFELSLLENVSRKSLLGASFTRAFSGYYIWTFWSRSRSLSNQASLAICIFLVLAYMLGATLYITMIAKEIPVHIRQNSDTGGDTLKEMLLEFVVAMKPYLHIDFVRDILCFTVTIAAVTWMLELFAYCIKKPVEKKLKKSKKDKSTLTQFFADKGCATSEACLSKKDSVAHGGSMVHKADTALSMHKIVEISRKEKSVSKNSVAHEGSVDQKSDTALNMRKVVQSRIQDLLHDTSVYVRFSQSDIEPHHSSLRNSDANIWKKVSTLVQTPPRQFPRRISTSHVDVTEKKYKCAACTVRKDVQEELSSNITCAIADAAKDIVQIIAEIFPNTESSMKVLRKKIRDRITGMHAYFDSSLNPLMEKSKLPVQETSSDGKLLTDSGDKESWKKTSSDITFNHNIQKGIAKKPSAVLSDFISKTVKVSVTSSAKNLMGLLMNNGPAVQEDTKAKNKMRRVTSYLSNTPLSEENIKEALEESMSALQGIRDTEMTSVAMTAAIKTTSLAAADKILATLTDTLGTASSGLKEHVKLSIESQEKLMDQVKMVLRDQHALVGSVKEGLHAQLYTEQFCETIMANAIIRARYLLTSGNDIPTERLLNSCRELVRVNKWTMGKQLARKIKKAMKDGEVKKEMIASAVQHMLVELDKLAGTNSKGEVSCCCEAINRVHMLATEDKIGLMDPGTIVGVVADDLVRNHCPAACDHVMGMMTTLLADQEGIQRLTRMPDAQGTNSGVNEMVTSPAQLMAKALLKMQQQHDQSKEESLDSTVSSLSFGGSDTSESGIWKNQNQNCVIDMSTTSSTWSHALKTAGIPTGPQMSDRDMLELEERQAAGPQGCLPSGCAVLLYVLLGTLMPTAMVTTVLYGAVLSSLQACAWLIYVIIAIVIHIIVLEPIKVFVILLLNKRIYL